MTHEKREVIHYVQFRNCEGLLFDADPQAQDHGSGALVFDARSRKQIGAVVRSIISRDRGVRYSVFDNKGQRHTECANFGETWPALRSIAEQETMGTGHPPGTA